MAYVITQLCLRDGGCATVCPVECIVPGNPQDKYPWYYIDGETCIDCGACLPECPFEAIYTQDDLPAHFVAKAGQRIAQPVGTPGFTEVFHGEDHDHKPITVESTKTLKGGEVMDLTLDQAVNDAFFKSGPGYKAL